MSDILYGVELSGKRGHNTIYFTSLSERMVFLNMINFGEFNGKVTFIEKTKPKEKQEEK